MLLGVAILISVIGNKVYEKTGLPESLFMIMLGLFAGPFTNLVPPDSFSGVINYIFTISLIVIILESGISTEIQTALNSMKHASLFTIIILIMSIGVCGSILFLFFDWNFASSIIMGIICSGTSTLPVIYMAERLDVKESVKNLLTFESILNDITLLTALTLTIEIFSQINSFIDTITNLLKYISEPLIYGSFTAILWTYLLLGYFKNTHLKYFSTLAVVTILYSYTEIEGGNGIFAILIFSILLGNIPKIARSSGVFSKNIISYLEQLEVELVGIRGIQTEMSFLAKNLFFFIMGIIFEVQKVSMNIVITSFSLIGSIFISRYLTAYILAYFEPSYLEDVLVIALMLPRGLTASLASYLPSGIDSISPILVEVTVLMVIFTNLVTIGISLSYKLEFISSGKNKVLDLEGEFDV